MLSFLLGLILTPITARVDTSAWVGTAYTPAGASNTMWWPWFDSYAAQIERELGAASRRLKMNTLRVFLHTKVYEANSSGLLSSVDAFLAIASRHGFATGLVLFDSCWNTDGSNVSQQCAPRKGVHNGCWYEAPEEKDKTQVERFRPYTEDVVSRFGNDTRVRWIEIYNEPRGPNVDFVWALRDAAYRWAVSLNPIAPVISCWDDSNNTEILDHHQYDVDFPSWASAVFANPAKGAVITEGGSRWYQPPFSGDYGSPLTVINFLEALRRDPNKYPFVPGCILNWELMVGNSNTRWHWGSPEGAAEPAVPWDGWMFPSGEPVSQTEAAALRRYVTGDDEFLFFEKFLSVPPIVEAGDAYLTVPSGAFWSANLPQGPVADGVFEASLWVEAGNVVAVLVRAAPLPAGAPLPHVVRGAASPPRASESYRSGGKRRGAAPPQPPTGARAPPPTCSFRPAMNNTDVCSGGPPGYRNLPVPPPAASNASAFCAAACCGWDECSVRCPPSTLPAPPPPSPLTRAQSPAGVDCAPVFGRRQKLHNARPVLLAEARLRAWSGDPLPRRSERVPRGAPQPPTAHAADGVRGGRRPRRGAAARGARGGRRPLAPRSF